jgi:hypothetical protein
MLEILDFFSIAPDGEVPVGLKTIRNTKQLNQPSLEEQKQYNFQPLFQQPQNFHFAKPVESSYKEEKQPLWWLNFLFDEDDDEEENEG